MKTITALASCELAAGMIVSNSTSFAGCGYDVHGSQTKAITELGENSGAKEWIH